MNIFQRLKVSHKIKLYTNQKYFNIFKEIFMNVDKINRNLINIFDIKSKYNNNGVEYTRSKLYERISVYWETLYNSLKLKKINYTSLTQEFNFYKPEYVSELIIKYLELFTKGILKILFPLSSKYNISIDYLKREYINLCYEEIKKLNELIRIRLERKKKKNKKKISTSLIQINKNSIIETNNTKTNNSFQKKNLLKISKEEKINFKNLNKFLSQSNLIKTIFKYNKEEKIKENLKEEIKEKEKFEFNNTYEEKEINSIAEGKFPSGHLVQQFLKQTDFDSLEKQSREMKYKSKIKENYSSLKKKKKFHLKNKSMIGKSKKFNFDDKQNKKNEDSFISFNQKLFFPKIQKNKNKNNNNKISNYNSYYISNYNNYNNNNSISNNYGNSKKKQKSLLIFNNNKDPLNMSTINIFTKNIFKHYSTPKVTNQLFLTKEDMFYQ